MENEPTQKAIKEKIISLYAKIREAKDGQEVNTILSIIGFLKQRIK